MTKEQALRAHRLSEFLLGKQAMIDVLRGFVRCKARGGVIPPAEIMRYALFAVTYEGTRNRKRRREIAWAFVEIPHLREIGGIAREMAKRDGKR